MNPVFKNVVTKNPFSTYDIFGYLIPGFTFFSMICTYEIMLTSISRQLNTPFLRIIESTYNVAIINGSWVISLIYFLFWVSAAYVAGHVIASASGLLIDRVLIQKGIGYPFEILLNLPKEHKYEYTRKYYTGSFFWFNFFLLITYLSASGIYRNTFISLSSKVALVALVFSFIFKLWLSHIDNDEHSRIYKFFHCDNKHKAEKLAQALFYYIPRFFILHIIGGVFEMILKQLSRYNRTRLSFNKEFIEKYKTLFNSTFELNSEKASTSNYWLPKIYIAEKSPGLNSMAVNWLNLYSFARNLAMSFYLTFLYTGISFCIQRGLIFGSHRLTVVLFPFILFVLFVIMLQRYHYLYHSYFSKFILRAFVVLRSHDI